MAVDLSGLGSYGFEQMCQALAVHVLGAGLVVFGDGPDGGREATFDGPLTSYPSKAKPWNGYVVLQAKFKTKVGDPGPGARWLRDQLKTELDAWANPAAARVRCGRLPEYLIVTTNVSLSAVPGVGGKDRIDELLRTYADRVGLKGWRVWDEAQIIAFLGAYPEVRNGFSTLTTSNDVLAKLLVELDKSRPLSEPAPLLPRYLPGEPGNEASFHEAYEAAGGAARLGTALGRAREEGPGWVQHFAGGPEGEPAVLCALFNRSVVAVARPVWNEVAAVGGGGPNSGTIGVGFPVFDPSAPSGFIGSDADLVSLAGGQWGDRHRGRLLRHPPHQSVWQPEISFDTNVSRARDIWPSDTPMDLRLRVAASIPWFADEWRITGTSRSRMIADLANCTLAEFVSALAERLGFGAVQADWREINPPAGCNNSRCSAHQIVVIGADDRPAVKLCVRLTLPDGRRMELLAVVDLCVDFDVIRPGHTATQPAEIPADLRVTLAELSEFFAYGWHVATMILPLAATRCHSLPLAATRCHSLPPTTQSPCHLPEHPGWSSTSRANGLLRLEVPAQSEPSTWSTSTDSVHRATVRPAILWSVSSLRLACRNRTSRPSSTTRWTEWPTTSGSHRRPAHTGGCAPRSTVTVVVLDVDTARERVSFP
jgi:hypothetical protein